MKSLLLLALGLARTVVLGARIEAERIVVSVRPYKREQRRCPVCGRACDFYDMANRGAPRLWRAMDLARSACYLEYAPCRVRCLDWQPFLVHFFQRLRPAFLNSTGLM